MTVALVSAGGCEVQPVDDSRHDVSPVEAVRFEMYRVRLDPRQQRSIGGVLILDVYRRIVDRADSYLADGRHEEELTLRGRHTCRKEVLQQWNRNRFARDLRSSRVGILVDELDLLYETDEVALRPWRGRMADRDVHVAIMSLGI